jgi:putative colanic acid biosynthesis acetyltransferase WcaF
MRQQIDISKYKRTTSHKEQFFRLLWNVVWTLFARPIPRAMCRKWKIFLLRCFGANIHRTANIYSGAKIYQPWNLEMGTFSCIASGVRIENSDKVIIGAHVVVSQKASIYTASHDISSVDFKWFSAPVVIRDYAWICAEAFVMMGVTIGEGAVVGARAAVFKDVEPWTVVGGNPAKLIKKRIINECTEK